MATAPAAKMQRAAVSLKGTGTQEQVGRRTQIGRGKMQTRRAPASRNGGLTRVDVIAAVLKRHRGLRLRELIAALGLESGPEEVLLGRI
jgi:hypothetical protein